MDIHSRVGHSDDSLTIVTFRVKIQHFVIVITVGLRMCTLITKPTLSPCVNSKRSLNKMATDFIQAT